MTPSTVVVIQVGQGGRPLLQTADSILRSTRAPERTVLARSLQHADPPLLQSVAARLGATVVEGATAAESLNAAIRASNARYLVFIRAGFMLDETFIDRCEAALARDASAAAVAPSIRLQSPDATAHLHWVPSATTAAAVLNDTAAVPPVFVLRHDLSDRLGGFDDAMGDLAEYELWLRLALAGHKIVVLGEPLVSRDMPPARPAASSGGDVAGRGLMPGQPGFMPRDLDGGHLRLFRAVLQKHEDAIASVMQEVLVAREVRFGQLREAHRELIARRDAGLAELDRLRGETAHLRAYIAHHHREAIEWGDLRRPDPVSRDWGYDRGDPIDRRYIDDFLSAHSSDVRGVVLEVQEDEFTRAYGGPRVTAFSVLDVDGANARASILADLRCAPGIPSDHFDCIVLTQTLHVIDDMSAVLRECHRILKPGGVLLATIPAASRVCLEYGHDGDFWRTTPAGARALFRSSFAPAAVSTAEFGNVMTNVAFLHGLATEELSDAEFTPRDPYFPALTGVRARKGSFASRQSARGVVLLFHRVEDDADVHDLSVPPSLFEAQLARLRQDCDVVPLDLLLESAPEALPERPVALTFDDGYRDALTTVAPLLLQYDVPATFFLTTRWLDEAGEYWWDLLARSPSAGDVSLHDELVHATLAARDVRVEQLRRSGRGVGRVRPLLADEVRELAAYSNIAIGAHSVNHLALPDQTEDVVVREIQESSAVLARLVGKPVDVFAYPYGAYDRRSAAVVRKLCRWGVSCDQRAFGDSFDAALVPRLDVKRWEPDDLAARVESLLHPRPTPGRRAFTL